MQLQLGKLWNFMMTRRRRALLRETCQSENIIAGTETSVTKRLIEKVNDESACDLLAIS